MIIFTTTTNLTGLAAIQKLLAAPRPLHEAGARAVGNTLRTHFLERNREGNKRGWPRRNFWSSVRAKVAELPATDAGGAVAIASPELAHKIAGGTIRPKRGKFLALPLTAQAYKAGSPREGGMDLFLLDLTKHGGNRFLARQPKGKKIKGNETPDIQYLLVASVHQTPDSRALPGQDTMTGAAHKAVSSILSVAK